MCERPDCACGKTFQSKKGLRQHLNKEHVPCPRGAECKCGGGKLFASAESLHHHLNPPSKKQCPHCDYAGRASDLKRHMKSKHPNATASTTSQANSHTASTEDDSDDDDDPDNDYATDITTDLALDFLRRNDADRPFCLVYQFKAPHRPFSPAP